MRWQGSQAEATLGKMANSLFRPFNDWEVDSVEQFLLCLHEKRVVRDEDDRMLWTKTKSGKFTVKSLYSALEPGNPISFPRRIIWNS